jgi:hypothetical protein
MATPDKPPGPTAAVEWSVRYLPDRSQTSYCHLACLAAPPAGITMAGTDLRAVRLGTGTRSLNGLNDPIGPTWEWGRAAIPDGLKTDGLNQPAPRRTFRRKVPAVLSLRCHGWWPAR